MERDRKPKSGIEENRYFPNIWNMLYAQAELETIFVANL